MNDAALVVRANVPEVMARFVEAWVADPDLSPHRAAEVIGHPGQAREFLIDPRVTRYYAALQQELRITYADLRSQNIQMLGCMADYDPAEAFSKSGQFLENIWDIPPHARAAIKKFKRKPDGSFEIEWVDRLKIIELLLGLFGDIPRENAQGGLAQIHFHGRSK